MPAASSSCSGAPTSCFRLERSILRRCPKAAAVTRARARGVNGLVVPTAGNAGAALAAYGAAAGVPVRVYAPATTPRPILDTIRAMGIEGALESVLESVEA